MQLPVPELGNTMKKYILYTQPLLTSGEYDETVGITEEFSEKIGTELQNMLLEEKRILTNTSWLYRHWIASYLGGRKPVTMESNFAMDLRFGSENEIPENFLSRFISALGKVCKSYRNNDFEKIFDGKNNKISLNQFEILRGSSRIPRKDSDEYNISDNNSNYISIFYKNNLYKLNIWDEEGNIMNFEKALNNIICNTTEKNTSLSTICFADNDKAAELRKENIDKNIFFNIIENSLFNISIINRKFLSEEEERSYSLYLSGDNTWLYKPLNFIYNMYNRKIFINCEHTYQDAGTIVEILKRAFYNLKNFLSESAKNAEAILINEYFDDDYVKEAEKIKKEYEKKVKLFSCSDLFLEINNGKLRKYSKDAVMQFILQYAQIKTFNRIRGMYEAVDMREYRYGRTECLRSVSAESVNFIESLIKNENKDDSLEKFFIAEKEHKNRIKNCKKAEGIDRHLYGLLLMSKRLQNREDKEIAKKFFESAGYRKVTENYLSTTSTGYLEHMGYLLFTPVIEKGMGITYLKEPEGIRYLISYYRSESEKIKEFKKNIAEGFKKIFEILEES